MKRKNFLQEIFDKIACHLLTQNKQSVNEKGHCYYRGPNGLKCAIGVIIPDKDYNTEFEHLTVRDSIVKQFFVDSGYIDVEISLLNELQMIHDGANPCVWKTKLVKLASGYSLNTKILESF